MIKPISKRKILLMLVDMAAINAAFIFSLFFRFDTDVPIHWMNKYLLSCWAYSLISLIVFSYCEFYDHDWRYMTNRNIVRFAGGVFISVLAFIVALYFTNNWTFPRTVILMLMTLATAFVSGIRLSIHMVYFWRGKSFASQTQKILIIGAGDAGESFIRDMLRKKNFPFNPVGFLDDDPKKKGMLIHGVPVLGKISDVKKIAYQKGIEAIVIAMPSIKSDEMRRIVSQCEASGVQVKKAPSLFDILDGRVSIDKIKNVDPEDILGRDLNLGDREGIAQYFSGKVIMVSGAGGSIGSELCRQVILYSPKRIILLDSSEHNVYTIDAELREGNKKDRHIPVVANVQSQKTLDGIFQYFQPDIVFHAAAYKHVPLMEDNVAAAVKNNIWGTQNIAMLAAKHKVQRFLMISTDKAVKPTNVMGATKRIAEMVVQSMTGKCETIFSAVRFGNVLNSNGSVMPLFKKQIANGGPVTVTHPEVVRYFMTISEAVQLVLTTVTMAKGGEVYVLEMGEPIKILDMAKSLIKLSGFEPDKDIKIKFIGLRPGEKLYEELLTDEEGLQKTASDRIFVGKPGVFDQEKLFDDVEELWQLADTHNTKEVLAKLMELVPGCSLHKLIRPYTQNKPINIPEQTLA
ncbi:MAG: polysaccharide biosynthesis protein [Candidatus Omnitrophica bacterium]|nr:polysaccharide biosynthesis protein [Candidatus Omnitrophota bacterium]